MDRCISRSAYRPGRQTFFGILSAILIVLPAWGRDEPRGEMLGWERGAARLQPIHERDKTGFGAQRGAASPRAGTAKMMGGFTCLPTCDTDPDFFNDPHPQDGKFLIIAGTDVLALSFDNLVLRITVPAGQPSFTIGVFDGDAGGTGNGGVSRWDDISDGSELDFTYTLLADPLGDGSGTVVVPLDGVSPSLSSTTFINNDWTDFTLANDPAAMAPSGNHIYRLEIQAPATPPTQDYRQAFKFRASGVLTVELGDQPFSYIGASLNPEDLNQIYPTGQSTPTAYDGQWSFFFDVPASQTSLTLWDGDFDRGDAAALGLTNQDTDDPNTAGIPPFADPLVAMAEGVATGAAGSTGAPPDDAQAPGTFSVFVRTPSVRYDLIFPDGQVFANENPSGNQEWEAFIGTVGGSIPADDYVPTAIPPGTYEVRAQGVDFFNLNALRLPTRLLCVDELGDPCTVLRPFLVGDTVFLDFDGNGIQDGGDFGVPGVIVNLLDSVGAFIATATTDGSGNYSFEVESGDYTVEIDASNFAPGGVLEGSSSTTGGETQMSTIVDDNDLDRDFGYVPVGDGSIGDYVWFDFNGNGIQDEPTAAGLAGVTVWLRDGPGGAILDTAVTDADGFYLFTGLIAGNYEVDVDESTLPTAFTPALTTGNEPLLVALGIDEDFLAADFGYRVDPGDSTATLGDLVWRDDDANGVQNGGEPGLGGVTVSLEADVDGDTLPDLFLSTVTGGTGFYFFFGLPGNIVYTVTVVDIGTVFPALSERTFDFDGVGTPDTAMVLLAPGGFNFDVDFGYREAPTVGSIGDRVWNDLDGDGVQDAGEPGINGVTVSLLDAGGAVVATAVTAGDGNYLFPDLDAGDYTVVVDPATLGGDFAQTFDLDGLASADRAALTLAAGEDNDQVDFGYAACGECDGKVSALTMQYTGTVAATVRVEQKNGEAVFPDTLLAPGTIFSFAGTDNGSFGSEIEIFVDGALLIELHTSCSQPIGSGLTFGELLILSGSSRDGGLLCPLGVCEVTGAGTLELKDREVKWELTNVSSIDTFINRIIVTWPAANGGLEEIKRDGDKIFDADPGLPPTSANIVSGWEGNLDKRKIKDGETDTLKLKFENDVEATLQEDYQIRVEFTNGCAVDFVPGAGGTFDCDKPIDQLTMIWDGGQPIRIKAWKGDVGSELLADIDNIAVGDEVSVSGYSGSPNDVVWEIFAAGTSAKLGESTFHLSCSDDDMDGPEDCGAREGNGKSDDEDLINDWLLEGMVDQSGFFDCTEPPAPLDFLVGDTVFSDADADGVQDAGDAGIDGVIVQLTGPGVHASAVTGSSLSPFWSRCLAANTGNDSQGLYCFGVADGTYTVEVAAVNFAAGGALEGATATTASPTQTDTVAGADVLTYDFGYEGAGTPSGPFECDKPIDRLTMVWDGSQAVRIKAWKGNVGSTLLADIDGIATGGVPGSASEVSVGGYAGSPNDVIWEIFAAGTSTKLGESEFHLSCSDDEMDGPEDCGNRQGDGKSDDASLVNDWLLEGMVDSQGSFDCTP